MIEFAGAGEGPLDHVIVGRLLAVLDVKCGPLHGGNGKPNLLRRLGGFNNAARFSPWLVIVDLDQDAECAARAKTDWLATPSNHMCFRIAVRSVEAWLLADAERLSSFLSIREAHVPAQPELLADPKLTLVNLARASRNRNVREDLVPRPESGRKVGAAYLSRMTEFVSDHVKGWRPTEASKRSDSLRRCLVSVDRITAALGRQPS